MKLLQHITEVPDEVFNPALLEISNIDWSTIKDPRKTYSHYFPTSTAVHLRIHKVDSTNVPNTVEEFSKILECANYMPSMQSGDYAECYKLANWVTQQVNGIRLGRVMIIRLEAGGEVSLHIDPGEYFEVYSRYHIPFKTNENVVFSGDDEEYEHMPYKILSRINNRIIHKLQNKGSDYRIHMIFDVETESGNTIF
jgi:uncharacterized protein with HEPN domain